MQRATMTFFKMFSPECMLYRIQQPHDGTLLCVDQVSKDCHLIQPCFPMLGAGLSHKIVAGGD